MAWPGKWRFLATGTRNESRTPENADGALDQTPIPRGGEIVTDLQNFEGGSAMMLPWFDAVEDPKAVTGVFESMDPTYPHQDVGATAIVGAYEGAYRTRGAVYQWGHEVSGGLWGDQELGRIMRFPANIPDSSDPYNEGVWAGDYRDELAAAIASNGMGIVTDDEMIRDLLAYRGPEPRRGRRGGH